MQLNESRASVLPAGWPDFFAVKVPISFCLMRNCEGGIHWEKPGNIPILLTDRIYRRRGVREPGDLEELLEKIRAAGSDVRVRDETV